MDQGGTHGRLSSQPFESPLGLVELGVHRPHEGIGPAQVADSSSFEESLSNLGEPRAAEEVFTFTQWLGRAVTSFPFGANAAGRRADGRSFAGDHHNIAIIVIAAGMGGHFAIVPDEVTFAGPTRTHPRRVIGQDGEVASEFPRSSP
jgi:hypothetical protein